MENNDSSIIPSALVSTFLVNPCNFISDPSTYKTIEVKSKKGISFKIVFLRIFMGFIIDETPITRRILKIFEPTTLPTAISLEFLRAAFILTAVSGELVPKDTIVRPISMDGTLNILAK